MEITKEQVEAFCRKVNKDFKCKEVYDCNIVCPLWMFMKVSSLQKNDGMSLWSAYKKVVEDAIDDDKAKKILETVFGTELEILRSC